ncbi:hypothetical protein PABG_07492 [Paracoccidioides brasiliensis Pb03]|nr:hypothetical protein PABG_07492 [Paracoccidioides brasiliensis Pb03]
MTSLQKPTEGAVTPSEAQSNTGYRDIRRGHDDHVSSGVQHVDLGISLQEIALGSSGVGEWKIFPQPQPMLQGALITTNRNQSEILNGIAGVLAKLIRSIHPTRYWNGFELFDLLWSIGKGHLCE